MHQLATRRGLRAARGGFIHVPYVPDQAAHNGAPSLPLGQIILGLRTALRAALTTSQDLRLSAGAEQ